ncbi:MAG: hypothetical protein C4B55_05080 [Candidatus Methanophagaceae archaeon]|nr:MAG: hypothetical protein C4B55_05080 [Methanophagales archaeon]
MKRERKSSRRKKRKKGFCVSVTLVAFAVLAVVLLALSSTASAKSVRRNYTDDGEGGFLWYNETDSSSTAEHASPIPKFYEGEKIYFLNNASNKSENVSVSGPWNDDEPVKDEGEEVKAGEFWDSEGRSTNKYYYVKDSSGDGGGWLKLEKQSLKVEIVGKEDNKKTKVVEGNEFNLRLKKNEKEGGVLKMTIENKENKNRIEDEKGTEIYEVLVRYSWKDFLPYDDKTNRIVVSADKTKVIKGVQINEDKRLVFNTSHLKMEGGEEYTIRLEDYATEVEATADIKVVEKEVEIECDEEVIQGDDIEITIKSSFCDETANITIKCAGEFWKNGTGNKTVQLDEDGQATAYFSTDDAELGRQEVTVVVSGMERVKYVMVREGEASLEDVPAEATVGDIVTLKGSSNFGEYAIFVIEDVFKKEEKIAGDKFEWVWDTTGETDGYNNIEIFILDERAPFSVGDYVSEDWKKSEEGKKGGVDASAGIYLLPPELTMSVPEIVSDDDEVEVNGTATGTDHVYLIVIDYKGELIFPAGGIEKATPVIDDKWNENIGELDSARYCVISVHKGKDGTTKAIEGGKWVVAEESLKGKSLKQKIAILEGEDVLGEAGSDDLYEKAYFTVSAPRVSLEVPGTVQIGDPISVTAETNIKDGERAFVFLSQNSSLVDKTTATVAGRKVEASLNTSGLGLQPGKYEVKVDVSGRASDEKVVTLVEKEENEPTQPPVSNETEPPGSNETEPPEPPGMNEPKPQGENELEIEGGFGEAELGEEGANGTNEGFEEEEAGEGAEGKPKMRIPLNSWDLLVSVCLAFSISTALKKRRRRRC